MNSYKFVHRKNKKGIEKNKSSTKAPNFQIVQNLQKMQIPCKKYMSLTHIYSPIALLTQK